MTRNFGIHFAPRYSRFHGADAAAGEFRQPRMSPTPAAANNMSGSAGLGGKSTGRPAYSAKQYNRADPLTPFPRGSLVDPGNPLLESDNFVHAVRDCFRVVAAGLFLAVTGVAVAVSVFMMFFCEF